MASRVTPGPPGTAAPPVLHTTEEAAKILRVRKSWLERRAAARKIPFTMLGGCYRFTDGHLAEIVRMHEQGPTPAAEDVPPLPRPRRNGAGQATTSVEPLRPRPRNGGRQVA
jgi:excisionase family DNA binding protein